MTTILSIESSSDCASIALLQDQHIISRDFDGVQTHSRALLPGIQNLLKDAGIGLQQCDALAFSCGPGAFTGVRTACGIVQGLAFGLNLPVISVVTLCAIAEAARQAHGCEDVLAVLDARMGEVYSGRYRYQDGSWTELRAPELISAAQLFAAVEYPVMLAHGKGVDLTQYPQQLPRFHVEPHAIQVAQLGLSGFSKGQAQDAALAQPLYVRNKVALTTAERILAGQTQK